ncbi:8847_t:CDS:2 [Diversispora eburnea]|uniref:8847_t:CDS:1 n=1 Tax=Diversispora eburnea TaxID=1213867 RepID=A0A9N8W378_9GLOM|nr:8847_t:CDS:2 [Diversispora eburnea]
MVLISAQPSVQTIGLPLVQPLVQLLVQSLVQSSVQPLISTKDVKPLVQPVLSTDADMDIDRIWVV